VRSLKVVSVDEESEPAHVVGEIGEDRPTQKLVPRRLPETLRLADRLRMLRSAPDVTDIVASKRALEVGLAPPSRVLATVVGQDLLGRAESRDTAFERLHHELRALMVRRRVRDDETRVVVHEDGQVHALMASEQKREDVGLPELIRRGSLESPRRMLPRHRCLPRLQ
jgi:hypothetical protein